MKHFDEVMLTHLCVHCHAVYYADCCVAVYVTFDTAHCSDGNISVNKAARTGHASELTVGEWVVGQQIWMGHMVHGSVSVTH